MNTTVAVAMMLAGAKGSSAVVAGACSDENTEIFMTGVKNMQRIQEWTDATGQPWGWTERKGVKDWGRNRKQRKCVLERTSSAVRRMYSVNKGQAWTWPCYLAIKCDKPSVWCQIMMEWTKKERNAINGRDAGKFKRSKVINKKRRPPVNDAGKKGSYLWGEQTQEADTRNTSLFCLQR